MIRANQQLEPSPETPESKVATVTSPPVASTPSLRAVLVVLLLLWGEVGVDLGQLVVDVLDGTGEVDHGPVGEGFDFPGERHDGVARDGRVNGEGLWLTGSA